MGFEVKLFIIEVLYGKVPVLTSVVKRDLAALLLLALASILPHGCSYYSGFQPDTRVF